MRAGLAQPLVHQRWSWCSAFRLMLQKRLAPVCVQGGGAWEPKQKTGKKARHAARAAAAARAQKPVREGGEAGGPSSPSDEDEEDDDDEDASEAGGGDQLVGQAQVRGVGLWWPNCVCHQFCLGACWY